MLLFSFFLYFFPMESLYVEQSDCERRMNFNAMEMEVLVEEVNTRSVKQRNKRNNR